MMWAAIVVGSVLSATYLIAFGLCKAAAMGDRDMQREATGERIVMQMAETDWRWVKRVDER